MAQSPHIIHNVKARYESLLKIVQDLSGFSREELTYSRQYPILGFRYAIMKILREEGFTLKQIASATSHSHASVLHAITLLTDVLYSRTDKHFMACYSLLSEHKVVAQYEPELLTNREKIQNWLEVNGTPKGQIDILLSNLNQISL